MMINSKYALLMALLCLTFNTSASGDEFQQQCAACHYADASGNPAVKSPNLTGQSAGYIRRQLKNYRDGFRGADSSDSSGQMMRAVALSLSDEKIDQLADYIAGMPVKNAPPLEGKGGLSGRGMFSGCKSCHGAKAEGFPALQAPRLAGQHPDYIKRQLSNFRNGLRGAHKDDKYGYQMALMAQSIPADETLDHLLEYISHLAE